MATIPEALAIAFQHHQGGRLQAAEQIYRQILQAEPNHVDAIHLLGVIARQVGKPEIAVEYIGRAIGLNRNVAAFHNNLGNALKDQGKLDDAVACYRRALELKPDFAEAHYDLGIALKDQGKLDDAVACYHRALELKPDYAEGHNNLGNALKDQGRLDDAVACYRRVLELKPDFAEAHNNLGNALRDQGKLDDAVACYRRALELKPDYVDAHSNQSLAWLLAGDFARGWLAYEWRWKSKQMKIALPQIPQPRWDGTIGDHQAVLLLDEQGLGDTLQFIRYVPLVRQRCQAVYFLSPRALTPLLSRAPGLDRLITELASAPPFDAYSPLLSVPGILGTRLETIPADVPYLFADPELVASWRERLQAVHGFRIGINWRGRPGPGSWCRRDLPLSLFGSLAAVPNVRLISLQVGATSDELAQVREQFSIMDFGDALDGNHGAFMDTAAIMMNLDLVITSDTAVPHLAGGLGVPVWTALPFAPDWRWMLNRTDSPWYPTMRLFRQPTAGDWESVFRDIDWALRELAAGGQGPTNADRPTLGP
jgi:tetratricopeptide (TPR) repeat protein